MLNQCPIIKLKNYPFAITYLDSADKFKSTINESEEIFATKVLIYYEMGEFEITKKLCSDYLKTKKTEIITTYYFYSCSDLNKLNEFIEFLETNSKSYTEVYSNNYLGFSYKLKNYKKSKEYYEKNLKLLPYSFNSLIQLAKISFEEKKNKKGCEYLKYILENSTKIKDFDDKEVLDLKNQYCK